VPRLPAGKVTGKRSGKDKGGKGKAISAGKGADTKQKIVSFGRDPSRVIFSALGRVLNCKREPVTAEEGGAGGEGGRGKLAFVPEDAMQEAQVRSAYVCVCICVCMYVCMYQRLMWIPKRSTPAHGLTVL